MPTDDRDEFRGSRNLKRLARISRTRQAEEIERCLELGLEGGGLHQRPPPSRSSAAATSPRSRGSTRS